MATIGASLVTPESGWQRFNDTNNNFNYINTWIYASGDVNHYNSDYRRTTVIGAEVRFNFIGTKLRILASANNTAVGGTATVFIDDVNIGTYSNNYPTQIVDCLLYEKTGLENIEHYVRVVVNSVIQPVGFLWDALDIDSIGTLKSYNITKRYLIKQSNQYYTIKSANYDEITTHNFTPLTLTGGTIPNKSDIETLGFNDLGLLTNSMTKSSDNFKPVDKFDNTAELKMYK